jgi:uncharacterized protein
MAPHRVSGVELTLESSGRRLAARLTEGGAGPAILFVHGLHSTQAGYEPRAAAVQQELGATSLTFDLAGHGESEGDRVALSPAEHLADVIVAYDALVGHDGVDPERVGVCGASYGGYLAALLTARRPVRRLLLRAPALYADEWLDRPLGERMPGAGAPATSAALDALEGFAGDVLVLESGRDEVIPHAVVEAYAAAGARHEVIAEATHRLADPAWEAAFVELLTDWFRPL